MTIYIIVVTTLWEMSYQEEPPYYTAFSAGWTTIGLTTPLLPMLSFASVIFWPLYAINHVQITLRGYSINPFKKLFGIVIICKKACPT